MPTEDVLPRPRLDRPALCGISIQGQCESYVFEKITKSKGACERGRLRPRGIRRREALTWTLTKGGHLAAFCVSKDMSVKLDIDVSELQQLSRAFRHLPGEIKTKAMARAMRRMRDMVRSRVVKRNAERVDMTRRDINKITTASFNAGGNTIEIVEKSGWIPLYALGAKQTKSGVRVRRRGSYASAFLAQMASGHRGVMKRVGKARLPIRELFGPNPAHDITNNPDVYLEVLAEVIEDSLVPRFLHELGNLLPR